MVSKWQCIVLLVSGRERIYSSYSFVLSNSAHSLPNCRGEHWELGLLDGGLIFSSLRRQPTFEGFDCACLARRLALNLQILSYRSLKLIIRLRTT